MDIQLQRRLVTQGNWIDRAIGMIAPRAALSRLRARVASDVLARHYEAASTGRRTQGWRRSSGDANAVIGGALGRLREHARDLVRNNGHAESAIATIADHVVGWGITAKPRLRSKRAADVWKAWAESTDCDADGRENFYGLQHLAVRTMVEAGEVLIRRRLRRPEDGLALPMQLQVIEPDYIDTFKTEITTQSGGRIVKGIEFDRLGRRVAYWLFRDHPGSEFVTSSQSYRVPAEGIVHMFRRDRPGQVRGATWYAPVILKMKDFDEFDDATLMKQKIAACLAVITTDSDGGGMTMGMPGPPGAEPAQPEWDMLEPGVVMNAPAGRDVEVIQPPQARDYPDYCRVTLRTIAAGLGVTYEDLTGDYAGLPYSAARMSRQRHWSRVQAWRWKTVIPQICDPVWRWVMEVAAVANLVAEKDITARAAWTAPPAPLLDPDKEGKAFTMNVRSGLQSLSEALRERGYDPDEVFAEIASDNKRLDKLKLILDTDPRNTTQQGQARQSGLSSAANVSTFEAPPEKEETTTTTTPPAGGDDEEDDDE